MKIRYNLEEYNYNLPQNLIAQEPTIPHHNAKILICKKTKENYKFTNDIFWNITEYIDKNYVLFLNDTKVIKARIPLEEINVSRHSGYQTTIKNGEILVYQIIDSCNFEALVSDDKNFKPGSKIFLGDNILEVKKLSKNGVIFNTKKKTIFEILDNYGQLPLPPYINYEKEKEQRYQTIFAKNEGSAAAPTASLHFTDELFKKLEEHNIHKDFLTLHVGLGTFKPIFDQDITKHDIHEEKVIIPLSLFKIIAQYKIQNKKILPVGTTMVRALESLPYLYYNIKNTNNKAILKLTTEEEYIRNTFCLNIKSSQSKTFIKSYQYDGNGTCNVNFQTQIYIYPGFEFKIIDAIITNFHLPKTSLMIMISARMKKKNLDTAYQKAIANNYKFYSFGDGMLIF